MRYPQSLFTTKLKEHIPDNIASIIDAPCGNGQTTYELAQYFPHTDFLGLDISEENISFATKKYTQLSNIKFEKSDIHQFVEGRDTFDCFCMINSLFLLPQPKELLQKIKTKLSKEGKLLLILPNPNSLNFKRYQRIAPDVNTFILAKENYSDFFNNLGFEILACEGIARVPFYGRWDTKLLYPIRNPYLFWLERRSKSEDYGYYLIVLSSC